MSLLVICEPVRDGWLLSVITVAHRVAKALADRQAYPPSPQNVAVSLVSVGVGSSSPLA